MSEINETLANANALLGNILLYAVPFVLLVITALLYSGLIGKLNENLLSAFNAVSKFLIALQNRKFKIAMLIITTIYIILEIIYLSMKG